MIVLCSTSLLPHDNQARSVGVRTLRYQNLWEERHLPNPTNKKACVLWVKNKLLAAYWSYSKRFGVLVHLSKFQVFKFHFFMDLLWVSGTLILSFGEDGETVTKSHSGTLPGEREAVYNLTVKEAGNHTKPSVRGVKTFTHFSPTSTHSQTSSLRMKSIIEEACTVVLAHTVKVSWSLCVKWV